MKLATATAAALALALSAGIAGAQQTGGQPGSPGAAQPPASGSAQTGAAASGMQAGMQSATGTIRSIDRSERTVVMEDGTEYSVDESAAIDDLEEGQEVRVQYRMQGSDRTATMILPDDASAPTVGTGAAGSGGGSSPATTGQGRMN
jgi:hypothetical protein